MLICCFSTDYVLVQDKSFKKFAKAYAKDQDLFFKEYVVVFHPFSSSQCNLHFLAFPPLSPSSSSWASPLNNGSPLSPGSSPPWMSRSKSGLPLSKLDAPDPRRAGPRCAGCVGLGTEPDVDAAPGVGWWKTHLSLIYHNLFYVICSLRTYPSIACSFVVSSLLGICFIYCLYKLSWVCA